MSERRRVAAVLAADAHHPDLEALVRHFGGTEVPGQDRRLAVFAASPAAVQCAFEVLQRAALAAKALPSSRPLPRFGIHSGEIVETGTEVYGDAVTVALKLSDSAAPGAVILSAAARKACEGKVPYSAQNLGPVVLQGLAAPLEVFALVTGIVAGAPAAPTASPSPTADPLIGRQLGPCKIESLLGSGGMGVIYKARHLTLDRIVAVKVLTGGTLGAAGADRLLAEARAAAAIEDPRIVHIYDAGQTAGVRYVVMQLVEGQTLEQRVVKNGPLSPEAARDLMREVLKGLSAAHKKGLVHRDIKPANIMIDASGAVKILDFGLAAPIGTAAGASVEGAAGSADYMPPEQAFDAAPSPSQDLYALGSTWFFALAGLPPYSGGGWAEMLLQHREAPIPDVRAASRRVTERNSDLIRRLMSKDPESRPKSAEAVLLELESSGFMLEVAAGAKDGSPFVILPPPPRPEPVGIQADPVIQVALAAGPAVRQDSPLPAPPPPLPPPVRTSIAAKLLLAGVFAGVFGRHWFVVGSADWLGLAAVSGAGLCALAFIDGANWARRSLSAALFAAMVAGLWALSRGGSLGVETVVAGCLGLILGVAGLILAFWTATRDRLLGAALLTAAVAVLFVVSAGMGLPEGTSWFQGVPERLSAFYGALRASGGLHRWTSVLAAGFVGFVAKQSYS